MLIMLLLRCCIVLLFGAITCASGSAIRRIESDVLIYDDDIRQIFEQHSNRKSIVKRHRNEPLYYVSYDLYDNVCSNDKCNNVATLFLTSVRKSAEPCDDFYTYACGKKQNKMLSHVKEIQEILEQQSIEIESTKALALEKTFYRSCLEQRDSDYKTKREFSKLLTLSNGISLFRPGHKFGIMDWHTIDDFYASLGFEHAFFNVHVIRDPEHNYANLIALTPPSPIHFYSVHGLLKHKNFTEIVSNLIGSYDYANPYVIDYEDVIGFNNALHEILPPLGMLEENMTTLMKNKMSVDDWQKVYDTTLRMKNVLNESESNHINWFRILNVLLKTMNLHINKHDSIVIKKLEYFTKLSELLQKTSAVTIEKYIHFKFLTQISKYLNPKLARFFENARDRSTFCIKQFDNQLIGTTYEYIKRHVPHEQKIYAVKIMNDVRNELTNLLLNANWMDDETKTYATNKLNNLQMIIGYPDWQANRTFINNYYDDLHLDSNFYANKIKLKRQSLLNEFQGLKYPDLYDPTTMSRKSMPLIYHFEVNSHMNRIFFPAEYLNEKKYKLFSPKLPSAINYGSIGSMLGSILYDYVSLTDNLKYNEFYTRSNGGLSKDTIEAYKIKEKCLSNQLSRYQKSSSKFNQQLISVIDRDTIQVDKIYEKMSGLRAAFEAYKKIQKYDEEFLPGFENMSKNQLFFLSYAERICEIGDIYDKYDVYETSLKVNGVVSNLKDFSDTFECSKTSKMNLETKCELFA